MKRLIISLLILPFVLTLSAQKRKSKKAKKPNIENSVFDYIDSLPTPDSFKNSSKILVGIYDYTVITKSKKYRGTLAKENYKISRYQLNDKNAVEEFSKFPVPSVDPKEISIRVIKPTGEIIPVDLKKNAIKSKTRVDLGYSSVFSDIDLDESYRIAVKNLEVGDQIELGVAKERDGYYGTNFKKSLNPRNTVNNATMNVLLVGVTAGVGLVIAPTWVKRTPSRRQAYGINGPSVTYMNKISTPVLNYQSVIENKAVEHSKFHVNKFNGFDNVKITEKSTSQIVDVSFQNMPGFKEEYYQFDKANIQYMNLQLLPSRMKEKYSPLIDPKQELSSELSRILSIQNKSKWFGDYRNVLFEVFSERSLKKLKKDNQEDQLKFLFYWLKRKYVLTEDVNEWEMEQSNAQITKLVSEYCKLFDIPVKWFLYNGRKYGEMSSISSIHEFYYSALVGDESNPYFFAALTEKSQFGVPKSSALGAKGYLFDPESGDVQEYTYSQTIKNTYSSKSVCVIHKDSSNALITSDVELDGFLIENYRDLYSRKMKNKDEVTLFGMEKDKWKEKEEEEFYGVSRYYFDESTSSDQIKAENKRYSEKLKDRLAERQKELIESGISSDLNQDVDLRDYEIKELNFGSFESGSKPKVSYNASYLLTDVLQPISQNQLILKPGYFFKDQISIYRKKDQERSSDISVSNLATYKSTIEFKLPKGAKVLNMADFNKELKSSMITVKYTMEQKGESVIFHFEKDYISLNAPKEEWSQIKDVLDLASELSNKNLIISL